MRVITMLGGTDGEYTAFIPEGFLDRLALRRLASTSGFEFSISPAIELRDAVVGHSVDWPGSKLGTVLVRRRKS